jgi:hypothetical protein
MLAFFPESHTTAPTLKELSSTLLRLLFAPSASRKWLCCISSRSGFATYRYERLCCYLLTDDAKIMTGGRCRRPSRLWRWYAGFRRLAHRAWRASTSWARSHFCDWSVLQISYRRVTDHFLGRLVGVTDVNERFARMTLKDLRDEIYLTNVEDGTTIRNIVYGDLMRQFEDHHKRTFNVLSDTQAQQKRYTFQVFILRACPVN